jgi:DNA helicase-2/ATP-dependent DNA helicase PcrA
MSDGQMRKWTTDSPIYQLDDSQREFCSLDGNVRLLAPAGSGKTQSLLWRCKAIADRADNTRPRFLIFTFTRAARDELVDRINEDNTFKDMASLLQVSTLNSWG